MTTPKAISAYMRRLQRKSAQSRWAKLTPEQRSQVCRQVRVKGLEKKQQQPTV